MLNKVFKKEVKIKVIVIKLQNLKNQKYYIQFFY